MVMGFSGLALLACQTPSTPKLATVDTRGYRVYSAGALIGTYPPAPFDPQADAVIESAFGLAVSDSAVFVLDVLGHSVHHLDLDGNVIATFGREGQGPGEFSSPVSIEVDRDGHVWIADPQLSRLSKFGGDGSAIAEIPTPYPVVNFLPLPDDAALIPTMEAATLVATIDESGATDVWRLPVEIDADILGGGVWDRLGLGTFRLAWLNADTALLFQDRGDGEFSTWRLTLDVEGKSVGRVTALPLPAWLPQLIEGATDAFLESVDQEFAEQHIVVPFRSVRAIDGTIWLSPNAGDQLMLMSVPSAPGDSASVVVPSGGEAADMVDAAVVGDRLVVLTTTSVRIYELDRVDSNRFSRPD